MGSAVFVTKLSDVYLYSDLFPSQVLPAVRQLLLLRRDRDRLLLHSGAEGGAASDPQQIPPLHLLRPLPHRYEQLRGERNTLSDECEGIKGVNGAASC